jgi:hypothetical protein
MKDPCKHTNIFCSLVRMGGYLFVASSHRSFVVADIAATCGRDTSRSHGNTTPGNTVAPGKALPAGVLSEGAVTLATSVAFSMGRARESLLFVLRSPHLWCELEWASRSLNCLGRRRLSFRRPALGRLRFSRFGFSLSGLAELGFKAISGLRSSQYRRGGHLLGRLATRSIALIKATLIKGGMALLSPPRRRGALQPVAVSHVTDFCREIIFSRVGFVPPRLL